MKEIEHRNTAIAWLRYTTRQPSLPRNTTSRACMRPKNFHGMLRAPTRRGTKLRRDNRRNHLLDTESTDESFRLAALAPPLSSLSQLFDNFGICTVIFAKKLHPIATIHNAYCALFERYISLFC